MLVLRGIFGVIAWLMAVPVTMYFLIYYGQTGDKLPISGWLVLAWFLHWVLAFGVIVLGDALLDGITLTEEDRKRIRAAEEKGCPRY